MAKKKPVKKPVKKKATKKVVEVNPVLEVDPVVEEIESLKPKCLAALKQARAIVDMQFGSVDSVFRHRLDCPTQRNIMRHAGEGYLAFQALLELVRTVNLMAAVPLDCKNLAKLMKELD